MDMLTMKLNTAAKYLNYHIQQKLVTTALSDIDITPEQVCVIHLIPESDADKLVEFIGRAPFIYPFAYNYLNQ